LSIYLSPLSLWNLFDRFLLWIDSIAACFSAEPG
jgi:hypothetical protein